MATKEYVQDRINSVKDKIAKANALIAKKQGWIEKKKAELARATTESEKYWIGCDISTLEGDIASKEKELRRELIPSLEKWENELIKLQQKVRDIPVLVEFLNFWKEKVADFYRKERTGEDRSRMKQAVLDANAAFNAQRNQREYWYATEEQRKIEDALWEDYEKKKDAYNDRFKMILFWESKGDFEVEMEKTLQQEWEQKYDRLVADVTREVGTIKDCKGLTVSDRGELNGVVIGENGKAAITTFVAGGWNIQCAHYRCRITKLKEK